MIDKPLSETHIDVAFRIAQGLSVKTKKGKATQQLKLIAYVNLPSEEDGVAMHKRCTDKPEAFEKVVKAFVAELQK